jgi:hypothetical protein
MSKMECRKLLPGLVLGAFPIGVTVAQEIPEPLPPLPVASVTMAPGSVVISHPVPAVVAPSWLPSAPDPVVLVRHPPKFVARKLESFHWRRLQGKLLGYPEEFQPRPLGASLYDHGRTMVANGEAARLVLHHYDFAQGGTELNTRGREQLAMHTARLSQSPYSLIIEQTPEKPDLAQQRRIAVLNTMATWSFPIAPDRVVVGRPIARGLSGIDAQIISANGMDRTARYGPPIPINSNGVNSPSGVTGP